MAKEDRFSYIPISRDTNTRINDKPVYAAQILKENSLQTGEFPVLNLIQRKTRGKKMFSPNRSLNVALELNT